MSYLPQVAHWLSQKRRVVTALRNEGFILLTMKIETKFSIGDKVWFMSDNKPLEVEISRIKVCQFLVQGLYKTEITYMVKFIHSTGCESIRGYSEHLFFRTKKELVQSL